MSGLQPFKDRAAEVGLTKSLVLEVVAAFYDKVRVDPVLGPVFQKALGEDWTAHIERINLFWLTVTRLGQGYDARNFMAVHVRNLTVRVDQLPRWLHLFRETAISRCEPEAATVLVDIAERMAESIKISLVRRDKEQSEKVASTNNPASALDFSEK